MRQDISKILQEISLRIQDEPDNEVRWDANTLCDYLRQFLNLKHCSPSSRVRLWQSLLEFAYPVEAQLRLEMYNGTLLREDIAWLLNFLDALDEAASLAQGSRLPLPVGYDHATREFLFEWTTPSAAEKIVAAIHESAPLTPGLIESWLSEQSLSAHTEKSLFAECLWTEVPDWEPNAYVWLRDSVSEERYHELAEGAQPTTYEIELYRTSLASSELRSGKALRVCVWQINLVDTRKAYILSFTDSSGNLVETGGPYRSFQEVDEELRSQGFLDKWTF